jgi:hypothetical protein
MGQEFSQYLSWLPRVFGYGAAAQFVPFGFNRSAVFGFASNRPTPDFRGSPNPS